MAITQAMCGSFKKELLEGKHDFQQNADQFKLALFLSSASLDQDTTGYASSGEVTGGGSTNYTAGGTNITKSGQSVAAVSDNSSGVATAHVVLPTVSFPSSTITNARGALIYNSETAGGSGTTNAVVVLDFGSDKSSSSGDFTITMPTADANSAIIRIS